MSAYDDGVLALFGADLAAYWPLDEASGNAVDATGNGWTGTVNGTPSYQAAGPTINGVAQHAVQTSGTSYFALSGSLPGLGADPGRCWFAWVYLPSTSSAVGTFYGRVQSGNREAYFRHSSSGAANVVTYTGDTQIGNATDLDLDGDVWHLMVGWWDSADGVTRVKVNDRTTVSNGSGTMDTSTATSAIMANRSGADPLRAGARMAKMGILRRVPTDPELALLLSGEFFTYHAISPTDDIATTGWTSTPLFSKVDDPPDSPDGTVITGTAS